MPVIINIDEAHAFTSDDIADDHSAHNQLLEQINSTEASVNEFSRRDQNAWLPQRLWQWATGTPTETQEQNIELTPVLENCQSILLQDEEENAARLRAEDEEGNQTLSNVKIGAIALSVALASGLGMFALSRILSARENEMADDASPFANDTGLQPEMDDAPKDAAIIDGGNNATPANDDKKYEQPLSSCWDVNNITTPSSQPYPCYIDTRQASIIRPNRTQTKPKKKKQNKVRKTTARTTPSTTPSTTTTEGYKTCMIYPRLIGGPPLKVKCDKDGGIIPDGHKGPVPKAKPPTTTTTKAPTTTQTPPTTEGVKYCTKYPMMGGAPLRVRCIDGVLIPDDYKGPVPRAKAPPTTATTEKPTTIQTPPTTEGVKYCTKYSMMGGAPLRVKCKGGVLIPDGYKVPVPKAKAPPTTATTEEPTTTTKEPSTTQVPPAIQPTVSTESITVSPEPIYVFKKGRLVRRRLTDEKSDREKGTATEAPLDDVKMEQVDFSCIEYQHGMSIFDWMRVAAAALQRPVSQFAKSVKVINSLEEGKGCPTDEEMAAIRAITDPLDRVMTTLLTLAPGSMPLAIAQNLIGPVLQLLADDLEGIEPDIERHSEINNQLLFMAWQFAHTLTPAQLTQLYNQPAPDAHVTSKERAVLDKRFSYHDGQEMITVDNIKYSLQAKSDHIPFIIDDDNSLHFVRYVNLQEKWEFANIDPHKATKNLEKKGKYGMALDQLPAGHNMYAEGSNDHIILNIPGRDKVTGVFVDQTFIPVKYMNIDNEMVAFTNTPGMVENVALKYDNRLGWQFDAPSTKMDRYLKMLLQSKDIGIKNNKQLNIAPINRFTGMSSNAHNEIYIKNDDVYFDVVSNYDTDTRSTTYNVEGFSNAIVKSEGATLKLKSEDNMLFPFRNYRQQDGINEDALFFIEKEAVYFLNRNGKSMPPVPKEKIHPGLHTTATGKMAFGLFDTLYEVTENTGIKIHIKGDHTVNRVDDIVLWSDLDYYVRVRDESESVPQKYKDLTTCRTIRAPGAAGSCLKLLIEEELDNKLSAHTDESASNDHPSFSELTPSTALDVPVLYEHKQSGKYYFGHKDIYFEAEIISPQDRDNPTGYTGIKLFGKGNMFTKRKHITDIFLEKKGDTVEMKTAEIFVAECIKTNTQIAENYLANRPWLGVPDMDVVEDIVSEVTETEYVWVDPQTDVLSQVTLPRSLDVEWQLVKKNLLPSRITESNDFYINIHLIESTNENLSTYEQNAIEHIKSSIAYITDKIAPATTGSLYYDALYWAEPENYLMTALASDDKVFINDVARVIRKRLKLVTTVLNNALTDSKIHMVFARPQSDVAAAIEPTATILTAEEMSTGPVALAPDDKTGHIFISIDKLNLDGKVTTQPNNDLITDILRAAFQISNQNVDYAEIEKINGVQIPIKDAIGAFINKMIRGELSSEQFDGVKEASENYIKNVAEYQYQYQRTRLVNHKTLAYLAHHDSGYLAQLLTHSPDFLTLITQDMYHLVSMKDAENAPEKIDARMRKYDNARSFALYDPEITKGEMPLTAVTSKEKIFYNTKNMLEFDADFMLNDMKKLSEIANAIAYPKENCEAITTTVAEYMKEKDFDNIRYRGMAFFLHGGDNLPSNHFAVVGRLQDKDYVFDLTAGQFATKYDELSGPIILSNAEWTQKYANLDGKALIIYGDFTTRSEARRIFGPASKFLSWGPEVKTPGAQILKRPGWYFPKTEEASPLPAGRLKSQQENAKSLRKVARLSQIKTIPRTTCWDYAASLLENAEIISRGPAVELANGLKKAATNQRYTAPTPGSIEGLFTSEETIENMEELLRVRAGKLIIFMQVDPKMPSMGARPIHAMVSIGNGRFAGIQNRKLDSSLSDNKRIYTAEQLGYFKEGKLQHNKGQSQSASEVIAASTEGQLLEQENTLRSLAIKTESKSTVNLNRLNKMTDLLSDSGELSEEQSIALRELMTQMIAMTDEPEALKRLFASHKEVKNSADLHGVAKGKLVIFSKSSSPTIEHFMYSLGLGDFVMINPSQLDLRLTSPNALVKASQFSDDYFSAFKITAGDVSLRNLRQQSLLGTGSYFHAEGKELTVRVHGKPSTLWNLDGFELAEIIKGLGLKNDPPVNWENIDSIILNARDATSGPTPTGKILAYIMQKTVTATPLIYNSNVRNSPLTHLRRKIYTPGSTSAEDLEGMTGHFIKLNNLWSRLRGLFATRQENRKRRDIDTFNYVVSRIADVVNGRLAVEQFFDDIPKYKQEISTSKEMLNELIRSEVKDDLDFAERCMDIINLSTYTMDLLDSYLAQRGYLPQLD